MVIHEGLELNQILILWGVQGWRKMDSHLERGIWSFIQTPFLQLFWESGIFFSYFHHFLENNPHSLLLI
jgi:hypothetical protein